MDNNIITTNIGTAMELPTFKCEALNKSALAIKSILTDVFTSVDKANRKLAVELGKVAKDESYKADGFKSVGEFAEKTFGIKSSKAYQLATAGEMYNNPNAPKALKDFSYTNFAEVSKVDRNKVEKAIADGTISATSSQKQLREWATANKADKKPKTETLYDFKARGNGAVIEAKLSIDTFKQRMEALEYDVYAIGHDTIVEDGKEVKLPRFACIGVHENKAVQLVVVATKCTNNVTVKILGKDLQGVLTKEQIEAFKAQGYTIE